MIESISDHDFLVASNAEAVWSVKLAGSVTQVSELAPTHKIYISKYKFEN
jgi:hypothetical protein